ncbi:MAG TPA: dienelactone hydrolase family protein [Thermoanaerobaculia bacterium]
MRRFGLVWVFAVALLAASCNRDEQSKTVTDEHAGHTTAPSTATSGTTATTASEPPAVASTLPDELVKYGDASGYLALPAAAGGASAKKPALVVIQEWWGVDDWIREQNKRFAGQGYVALAPDLYRGRIAKSPEEAHELMRGMPEDRAMADLKAAVDYLAARPDVDPNRIGVIGWCMGGGYALALATAEPRLKATVINYGRLVTDTNAITKINAPVLGNFGGADRGIPADDVKKFGGQLTQYGKLGDIKVYDGVGHAFMNPNNKEGYDAAAARDAWDRIDRFFDRTLRATISNS